MERCNQIKIYRIIADNHHYSSFLEVYEGLENSIQSLAMDQAIDYGWKPFEQYTPPKFELYRSDTGKRNYQFDFCDDATPFLIFSEHAATVLHDILAPRGQFLEVIMPSKRKKFIGYYPTNCLQPTALDLEKAKYRVYEKGVIVDHHVLRKDRITDDYLFTIEESRYVFVTEKFKQRVEEHNLLGFRFSDYNEIELS